jgi:nitrogen fixation NifU-like protein
MMFDDVRDLYQDIILRHSRAPANQRRLEVFDASAKGDNPMCGDRCEVRIALGPKNTIQDIGFEGRGCAISIASADLMADVVRGMNAEDITALARDFDAMVHGAEPAATPYLETLRPLSGVAEYPSRIKCATLPWAALKTALGGGKEASSE